MELVEQLTPVMGQEERRKSLELSLRRLCPPLKVPGYEQERFIGRGAFGEVWSAVDSNSGRRVAIKFYSHRGALDWSNMAREVEKLRFLFANRYVVQLFEVGWESDPPYFIMEHMPFGSLADRLRQGPLAVEEAVRLFREIATGLVHAHGRGVLHCDLKPGNIMLDEEGRPRLADFGQSRLTHEHAPSLGTFFYMAPEQADPQALPDVRWDVYALGAILYQLVTGKAPYQSAESLSALSAEETLHDKLAAYRRYIETSARPSDYRKMPGVDPALATIIHRCLAVDPAHRYANVQAVLDALHDRDRRRRQKPLLQLGTAGPLAVVVMMAVVAFAVFNRILSTAEEELLERTLESNRFAAHLVASRFGLEIDQRWRALEHEASAAAVQTALNQPELASSDDGRSALQTWLQERHRHWNTQFSATTPASYWYVLDRRGHLRAISPPRPALVGRYFGYRDYYHGRGDDRETDQPRQPIRSPHRSDVFLSQPENVLSVAFSVPIRNTSSADREPLGVLVLEADLGHFAEFTGARHQFAAIVDLRPDAADKAGLIAEHPQLHDHLPGDVRRYVSPDMLGDLKLLHARHLTIEGQDLDVGDQAVGSSPLEGQWRSYLDPLDPQPGEVWLCSAQPVLVARGSGTMLGTGWIVLVEERRQSVVEPLRRLWKSVVYGALVALGLVVLILTALWSYVLCHLSEDRGAGQFLKRLTGMAESLRSTGSLSLGTAGTARSLTKKVRETNG